MMTVSRIVTSAMCGFFRVPVFVFFFLFLLMRTVPASPVVGFFMGVVFMSVVPASVSMIVFFFVLFFLFTLFTLPRFFPRIRYCRPDSFDRPFDDKRNGRGRRDDSRRHHADDGDDRRGRGEHNVSDTLHEGSQSPAEGTRY